jgi:hypothetical protein
VAANVAMSRLFAAFLPADHHCLEILLQQMDCKLSEIDAKTPLARVYDLKSRMDSLANFLDCQLLSDESKRLLAVHLSLNQIELEQKNSEQAFNSWHR